ncbi:MAG: glycosyltransferase [Spirochaetes bacterium]|nr:glycosyltransferase [Spirochaetota bacterium]
MTKLKEVSILHINTADSWRGGEKQTFYLVYNLHKTGYSTYCVCRKNSPLHNCLLKNEVPHFPLKMRSEFDIPAAVRISRIAKDINAKILHMHTAHAHSLGYLSNFFYKVPVNIVARRVDYHIGRSFFSRIKYKYPQQFITVSDAIGDVLVSDGIPEEKIQTVYSGMNPVDYKNIKTDHLNNEFSNIPELKNKMKFINTAALTHQKDHETLLNAVSLLKKKFDNFILFIAGEGELHDKLLKQQEKLSLKDNVVFTGFRHDVLSLIKFSDIFVMSSRWEGLGTSIVDAMAMKKPIIATNTGGIPELIQNNYNGIVVTKENPEELSIAMHRLIMDKALQKKFSDNAYKKSGNFTIDNTVKGTIEVYKSLLEGKEK